MSENPSVAAEDRVSDAERERVVRDLTKHCGDGRLTLDELEDRVAEVYAATTVADIQHALRELPRSPVPAVKPSGPPVRTTPSAAPVRHSTTKGAEIALKVHLAVYLSVMALLVLIYTLTMFGGYFWPIWPAMGWGTAVAIQAGITKAVASGESRL